MLTAYRDYSYKYNSLGMRIRKNAGEHSANFYYAGDRLLGEDRNYTQAKIRYMHDQQGIVGARYHASNGSITEYEYVKDAFGNVVAVMNGSNVVVQYRYDAWGNCTEVNKNPNDPFANNNPIRYRSYYMDLENGYYYLQSRYYDPEIGAFISPDSTEYLDPESIGGLNLYAYCLNNPVMYYDPTGHFFIFSVLVSIAAAGIAGAVAGTTGQVFSDVVCNFRKYGFGFSNWEFSSWETYVGSTIGGAIGGVLSTIPIAGTYIGAAVGNLAATSIGMGLENATGRSNYSALEIGLSSLFSAGIGLVSAGVVDYTFKVKNINVGSHSFKQVFKSGLTKNRKYTYSISLKTFGKGVAWHLLEKFSASWYLSYWIEGYINSFK